MASFPLLRTGRAKSVFVRTFALAGLKYLALYEFNQSVLEYGIDISCVHETVYSQFMRSEPGMYDDLKSLIVWKDVEVWKVRQKKPETCCNKTVVFTPWPIADATQNFSPNSIDCDMMFWAIVPIREGLLRSTFPYLFFSQRSLQHVIQQ